MERTNKFKASKLKKSEKELVGWMCKNFIYAGSYPAQVTIRPHFKNMRKDLDNTRYKGILDGLVAAGVIKNDNLKHIQRIVLEPVFDDTEGIGITIEPLVVMPKGRIVLCKDCCYMGEGSYCNLWHKYGLGGEHFCSYGDRKAEP